MGGLWLRLTVISLFVTLIICDNEELLVRTKYGQLLGKYMETKTGREFRGFTGIPYAKPPVGALRFKSPQPPESWADIKDATQMHAECPQKNSFVRLEEVSGNEDCLFLNVYTPKRKTSETPLPVMMFVHGGGFHCGSGITMAYGPDFLLDHDIVLVVINYRLGALGFLSTGDDVVPGNNGMKDQTMALRWIHENIKQFGGDPNMVTVFGESAGGASSHLHMMSPLSKGLVHRIISESGTAFENWAVNSREEGLRLTIRLAKALGCSTDSSQKMVDCLRKVDTYKLIEQQESFHQWDIEPLVQFIPVIESDSKGAFLIDWPRNIVKKNKDSLLPWMNGLNTDEGAFRTTVIVGMQKVQEFEENFDAVITMSMHDATTKLHRRFLDKIKKFYFGTDTIGPQHRENITNLYTDLYFVKSEEAVSSHVKHTKLPVYYYLFGYRGAASFTEPFGKNKENFGVCHADELIYLFPITDGLFPDTEMTKTDREMARVMTGLWANFAKHGNPAPERSALTWKPVQTARNEYLYIGNDVWEMRDRMHEERLAFWRNFIENADKFEKNEL